MKLKTKRVLKIVSTICFILLIVFFIALITTYILRPAYISYASVCTPEKIDEDKYITPGVTTVEVTDEDELIITIIILEEYKENKRILKHEYIHYTQVINRRFSLSCKRPLLKYLSECEAYLGSYYFDWFYERIYNIKIDEIEFELN